MSTVAHRRGKIPAIWAPHSFAKCAHGAMTPEVATESIWFFVVMSTSNLTSPHARPVSFCRTMMDRIPFLHALPSGSAPNISPALCVLKARRDIASDVWLHLPTLDQLQHGWHEGEIWREGGFAHDNWHALRAECFI